MRRPSAAGSPRRRRSSAAGVLPAGSGVVALALLPFAAPTGAARAGMLTPAERAAVLTLGPWPPPPVHDVANPASGRPAGIALGEALFYSARLSPSGLRCASCHEPWRHFADGRAVAQGMARGSRNTPTLLDAARHRHYGWDGAHDQLWRQSLRPLEDVREMPATGAQVGALLRHDAPLAARYAAAFGAAPGDDDVAVARSAGRALAAYVETLVSPRTPFDAWRDRLAAAGGGVEPAVSGAFPPGARRGLRLFVGRAGCAACHGGPTLGDDAFHASLVHSLTAAGTPDAGRRGAVPNAFRTPSLRGAVSTGPWMHDGSAARLCDALRPHAADPGVDPPALTAAERGDLAAFLRTLAFDAATDAASGCAD
jgi:cytochrome c peroxidase